MIENFVNSIGGYESWQFIALLLGTLTIGLILRLKWVWTMPVLLFGIFLGYLAIEHAYAVTKSNIPDPVTSSLASTFSILFVVISLLVAIDPSVVARMFGISKENKK